MPAAIELSVLFVNYNSWGVLADALGSLRENPPRAADGAPLAHEVVVVDNASPLAPGDEVDRVRALLAGLPHGPGELVHAPANGGYAAGMNLARSRARGRMLLVCNPDVLFLPGCVDGLLRYLEGHPEAGAAAPETFADTGLQCRLPTGRLPRLGDLPGLTLAALSARAVRRYARRRTPRYLPLWEARESIELEMFAGWCFLIRAELVDEIGFFDERYPLYYEDADLSLRVRRAGRRIVQVAGSRLVHLYNRSGRTDPELAFARYRTSRRAYYRRWHGRAGALLHDACERLLATAWARRRAVREPWSGVVELDRSEGGPRLRLPRGSERFLVEVAFDPYFYLAAGAFGSGAEWAPGAGMLREIDRPAWFRVVDLAGRALQELGVYRYDPGGAPDG